jgi:D-arabinose 1-dehydrogenase-like Zn-dependent alcohol dehydrogenase
VAAKLAGANVYGVDVYVEDKAIQLGAKQLFLDGRNKFDVIISTVGHPKVISQYFDYLDTSGRFVLLGQPPPEQSIILPNGLKMFGGSGQQFLVSEGGNFNPDYDLNRYLTLEPNINTDIIIGKRFNIEQINEAISTLMSGQAGRILIDF